MEIEVIHGQIIAKANHYQAVPGKFGAKRIIKDEKIRAYEKSFMQQCRVYRNKGISGRFRLFVRVYHSSVRFVEKPRDFDPFGQTEWSPLATI